MPTAHDKIQRIALAYQALKEWRDFRPIDTLIFDNRPSVVFAELYAALDDLPVLSEQIEELRRSNTVRVQHKNGGTLQNKNWLATIYDFEGCPHCSIEEIQKDARTDLVALENRLGRLQDYRNKLRKRLHDTNEFLRKLQGKDSRVFKVVEENTAFLEEKYPS